MKAVKVQFKNVGKKYYFSPNGIDFVNNDYVVVETIRGIEVGRVVGDIFEITEAELIAELKPVIRKANEKDIATHLENRKAEELVMEKSIFLVRKNKLEMKLLGCDYTLDRGKLIIYFEADCRVDFRQLVKDLAEEFRTRIELRQVGSRDGAKYIGGIGPCGLVMCCCTHIGEFDNVSIKMAKNQDLSLNPQKISGTCGKLLCCIKFENEVYQEMRESMPDINDHVIGPDGRAKVIGTNVLGRKVKLKYENEKIGFCDADEVKLIEKTKLSEKISDDLKELE